MLSAIARGGATSSTGRRPDENVMSVSMPRLVGSPVAIAIYIAACAVITLVATALMTDYTGRDISGEYPSR